MIFDYNVVSQEHLPDLPELVGSEKADILYSGENFITLDVTNELILFEKTCNTLTTNYVNSLALFKSMCEFYIMSVGPDIILMEELAAEAEHFAANTFGGEEDPDLIYDKVFELTGPISALLVNINKKLNKHNLTREEVMPFHWDQRLPSDDSLDRILLQFVCIYKK